MSAVNTLGGVPRDRWQRPLVQPVGGGKAEPYTRCTTFVGCLEDTYNLSRWQQRNVAIGLSLRPDLVLKAAANRDEKNTLNDVCDQASEAAAASAAATTGTALHKITEAVDRGEEVEIPDAFKPDIEAYRQVTKDLTMLQIETFVVNDELKVGGTFDRVVSFEGKRYVADLKTGASMDYGRGKIAMQLAMYAQSRLYDPASHDRTDLDADLEKAIVIHVPAGTGKAFLYWVDIARGWEAVMLASQVRAWRSTEKSLFESFAYEKALPIQTTDEANLYARIMMCQDVAALRLLWVENQPTWTPAHTEASKARKAELTN